jgi:hypothetical protein
MAALAPRLLRSPGKGGKPGSRRAILYLTSGCVKSSVLPPPLAVEARASSANRARRSAHSWPNRPANRSGRPGPQRSRRAFLPKRCTPTIGGALEMPWPVAGSNRSSLSPLPSRRAAACGLSASAPQRRPLAGSTLTRGTATGSRLVLGRGAIHAACSGITEKKKGEFQEVSAVPKKG